MDQPASEPEQRLIDNVVKLVRQMRRHFDARARAMDLTYARAQALLVVQRREGATQTEIAEALEIETSSVNRILDGLEESGFIERRAQTGDKRVRCIFLTDLARARAERVLRFKEDLQAELFAGLDSAEIAAAVRVLERAGANLAEPGPR